MSPQGLRAMDPAVHMGTPVLSAPVCVVCDTCIQNGQIQPSSCETLIRYGFMLALNISYRCSVT